MKLHQLPKLPDHPTNRQAFEWQRLVQSSLPGKFFWGDAPEQFLCYESEELTREQPSVSFMVMVQTPVGYSFVRKSDYVATS